MKFIWIVLLAAFATPALAEKGDIYDCKFKVSRGQWLVDQVIVGVGHKSGNAYVYDGMVHVAYGKPMQVKITQNDDSRLVFRWTVPVTDSWNMTRKVNFRLTYIKKNKRATVASDVAGYENHDTARGSCARKIGEI